MDLTLFFRQIEPLCLDLIQCIHQQELRERGDLVTLRTVNLHTVGRLLKQFGLSWNYVIHLFKTHSYVHPDNVEKLKNGDDDNNSFLAQGFVKSDKLVRMLKSLEQQHGVNVAEILALDGLSGDITNGTNFEHKYYLRNLKFSQEGAVCDFDEDPSYKRQHALSVRRMYRILEGRVTEPCKHVYNVLREVLKDWISLPPLSAELEETLSLELFNKCADAYKEGVQVNEMKDVVKNIKLKGEKRCSDEKRYSEDETPSSKIIKIETE